MAQQATLVEQEGDTFERNLKLSANDNPIDITGWTFVLSIKEQRSDSDANAVIRKEVTTHDNPTNGETSIGLSATETEDLFGDYWYDLKYKTDNGVVDTIIQGAFRVEDSITDTL